ncbi:MAG: 50S ribosomal protein L25/general stress protein Ctc [Gammaproteobacteria bacterium]|nr:50S ribosomal protein L25/general stress protein Ctc [Gammaproteobacteria bacterium]
MSTEFVLNAELRTDMGKGAVRRMRRAEKIPAIIYGTGSEPVMLSFLHKDIKRQLENEAFYSNILTVDLDGKKQQAVLKDLQRHPSKPKILHLDLLRVSATEKITMQVPLHFTGEEIAPGVKEGGGLISHQMSNVEIRCLAKDLPEFLEVDMSNLGMNESVHLVDIKLPDGVEMVALGQGDDHNLPVANIHMPKAAKEEVKPEGGADSPDAAAGGDDKGDKS